MPDNVLRFQDHADALAPGIVVLDQSQTRISPHAHAFYEFVYIREGFCLHGTDEQTALVMEGDCFLITPGNNHSYIGSRVVQLYNFLFLEEAFQKLRHEPVFKTIFSMDSRKWNSVKVHLDLNEQKRVSRLLRGMIEDQKTREIGWQTRVLCQGTCVLIDYARALERRGQAESDGGGYPNYVAKALEIVGERYSDSELTVAAIAAEVGVTPDYLSRQFRTITGVGVQEYLRRCRFARAADMLASGASVSDTAKRVGFASLSHFSREFKKELGVAPSGYARVNDEKQE